MKIKSENKSEDLSDDDKKLIVIIIDTYHNLSYSSCYIDWMTKTNAEKEKKADQLRSG